eukprot:4736110-Prymnesium_polylepis.1
MQPARPCATTPPPADAPVTCAVGAAAPTTRWRVAAARGAEKPATCPRAGYGWSLAGGWGRGGASGLS